MGFPEKEQSAAEQEILTDQVISEVQHLIHQHLSPLLKALNDRDILSKLVQLKTASNPRADYCIEQLLAIQQAKTNLVTEATSQKSETTPHGRRLLFLQDHITPNTKSLEFHHGFFQKMVRLGFTQTTGVDPETLKSADQVIEVEVEAYRCKKRYHLYIWYDQENIRHYCLIPTSTY